VASFVLVPGAGGSALYWSRLVPVLQARGHDALAVDLPAADDDAGLQAYVEAVLAALRAAGLHDGREVVVVAQSMGGLTGPLLRDPVPVRLLVLLNAMVPLPGETGHEWWAATGHQQAVAEQAARDGVPPELAMDPTYAFLHDLPPDVLAELTAAGEPAQSGRPFDDPWPLEAWPDVPTRVLHGRDDRFFPLAFQREVVRARLGLPVDELPGGHLLALSRPQELADRLEAYLEQTPPTG